MYSTARNKNYLIDVKYRSSYQYIKLGFYDIQNILICRMYLVHRSIVNECRYACTNSCIKVLVRCKMSAISFANKLENDQLRLKIVAFQVFLQIDLATTIVKDGL